jgi:hypothetical protein
MSKSQSAELRPKSCITIDNAEDDTPFTHNLIVLNRCAVHEAVLCYMGIAKTDRKPDGSAAPRHLTFTFTHTHMRQWMRCR